MHERHNNHVKIKIEDTDVGQFTCLVDFAFSFQHFEVCMNGNKVDEVWCPAGSYFPNVRL